MKTKNKEPKTLRLFEHEIIAKKVKLLQKYKTVQDPVIYYILIIAVDNTGTGAYCKKSYKGHVWTPTELKYKSMTICTLVPVDPLVYKHLAYLTQYMKLFRSSNQYICS